MKKKVLDISLYVLSFIIPFFVALLVFKNNGMYPFYENGKTVLMVDSQGQYIAFYRYYKAVLSGNEDIIYTLGKSLGGDALSLFTFYLASPFNIIFLFTNEIDLPVALLFITITKIATAGLTSYIFFKKVAKSNLYALIFSISYSLMSYSFVYHSNIMWLDATYLLPLVLLGVKINIDKDSPTLYLVTLSLSLFTSWYIGYMICIFVVFFYIAEILKKGLSTKILINNVVKFGIYSLIGGCMSAFAWLSAFMHLGGTKGSVNLSVNVIDRLKDCFYVLNIFRFSTFKSFDSFNYVITDGIHIYVGALASTFLLIYFVNKNIELKHRIYSLIPLGVLILGFISVGIDNLWHGGSAPTWFPFRYAFIYGLYVCYLATQTMNDIDNIHPIRLLFPLGVLVLLSYLSINITNYSEEYPSYTPNNFTYIALSSILILVVINYYLKKYKWANPLTAGIFIIFNTFNMYYNSHSIISTLSEREYLPYEKYKKDEELKEIINAIKNNDSSFYRLEKTFIRDGTYNGANNDSLYYGYNGLSHYSSHEKKEIQEYLCRLGFHYNYFWEKYGSGSTLSINSFLGIKYILAHNENSYDYLNDATAANSFLSYLNKDEELSNEDVRVFKNPYYLSPLMIVNKKDGYVNEGIRIGSSTHWYDHFEFQNQIFKTMTNTVVDEYGKQKEIFKKAEYSISTSIPYEETSNGKFYPSIKQGESITYSIKTDSTNPYYYAFKNNYNYLDIFRDKLYFTLYNSPVNNFSYYNSGINGFPKKDGTHTIRISARKELSNHSIIEEFYYEDLSALSDYINEIKKQEVKEISVTDSTYKYQINVTKDDQIALLTVPYEENFKIYLDGQKVDAKKSYHIFLGVDVPLGEHIIEIKYEDKGFTLGLIISSISFLTCFAYILYKDFIDKKSLYKLIKL